MTHAKVAVAALLIGFVVSAFGYSVAQAIETIPTPDEYWLKDTEVKIAAYRRTTDGADLQYIEVFNDSDHLVDVSHWKFTGVFGTSGARYDLPVTAKAPGMLEPKAHAVIQAATEVAGASFDGGVWTGRPEGDVNLLLSLEVTGQEPGWKTDIYTLKSSTKTVLVAGKSTTVPVYDDFWVRTQISGESYTSTLSSFTAASERLFDDGLYEAPTAFPGTIEEIYPYASECVPNDSSVLCGDYIKIHVDNNADISAFLLRTDNNSSSRTTSNTFSLAGLASAVTADGFLTVRLDDNGSKVSLTNSGGYVWIESLYDQTPYAPTLTSYAAATSAEQGYGYARTADGSWQWTTTPSPDVVNVITTPVVEAPVCTEGKYLNPETGRCRTIEEAVNALAACPEGQERNPTTNRCRSKVIAASAVLEPCGEGQERNPATNRCRSIVAAVAELLPCDEGYERNPATNRCRKVAGVSTTATVAPASLVEQAKGSQWDAWTWALVGVGATGAIGYGVYEWRKELATFGQKIAGLLARK